jgi:outer membrane protein OmpA-like peptidoglycan-associated protein
MSHRRTILYLFVAGCLYATSASALPCAVTRIPAVDGDSCPVTHLTSISFPPGRTITLHVPSDRVIYTFKGDDTSNKIIMTCITRSEDPDSVPEPHPNLHRRDTITVHFGSNQSSLSPGLDSIIDAYFRRSAPTRQLTIAGYCDNTGDEAYNNRLSLNRAQYVNDYLRQHWPDSIARINLTGYGIRYPIGNNNTAPGRALNRRVTIIVTSTIQEPAPSTIQEPNASITQPATSATQPTAATPTAASLPQTPRSIYNAITDTNTRVGATIVLKDVVFYGGRCIPLPISFIALDELVKAMQDLANLRIRIEGHVCCTPDNSDGRDEQTGVWNLSTQRAKVVFDYLVKQGIPKYRMTCVGLGGSGKLYPEELDAAQQAANRRVEIRIISK